MVQSLMGQPKGGFHNTYYRLMLMNQAQREMSEEARALNALATIPVSIRQDTYDFPDDFLTFAKQRPYVVDPPGANINTDIATTYPLIVQSPIKMDRMYPFWVDPDTPTTPAFLIQLNDQIRLYPTPDRGYDLKLPYLVDPDELTENPDSVPFNGVRYFNRFAVGIAYKTAELEITGRDARQGFVYSEMYRKELRAFRTHVRSNPQVKPELTPVGGFRSTPSISRVYFFGDFEEAINARIRPRGR